MSIVIQPKRWNIKPPPGVLVQRGHAAAQALTSCVLFNEGSFRATDQIRNESFVGSANNTILPSVRGTMIGGATGLAGRFSIATTTLNLPIYGNSGPFSVLIGFRAISTATTNTYLYNEASGANQVALIFGFAAGKVEFYGAGFSGTDPRTGSQITVPDTNLHLYGYTYKGQSNEWAYWLDGVKTVINASISFIPGAASPTKAARTFFDTTSLGNPMNGQLLFFYSWNRYVDMAQFQSDPYCFLQPQNPQQRFWVPPSAAGHLFRISDLSGLTSGGSKQLNPGLEGM